MTVGELIKRLQDFNDDSEVIFADYEPVVAVVNISNDDGDEYCVITDR